MGRRGLAFLFPLVLIGAPAAAQMISKGGVSGTIQTFRAVVGAAPAPPVAMLTTPAKGVFILTQACATNSSGFILDSGNPALPIVSSSTGSGAFGGNSRCVTYTPGLALPPGATITCNNADTGDTNSCLVTGVLSRH